MVSKQRQKPTRRRKRPARQIGWRECVGLPDLGILNIKAKIDTGARTSALYAADIRPVKGGEPRVAFTVPLSHDGQDAVECVAPLMGKREIKNTSGVFEERFIIKTLLVVDRRRWHIEISLADRANMEFDLILGRTALRGHGFSVNPSRSFLVGEPFYRQAVSGKKNIEVPS